MATLEAVLTRGDFSQGRKFRVIKDGCRLWGMRPCGPSVQEGWTRKLSVGDVLTCDGTSMTFGDGVPVVKWRDENGGWLANDCEFQPSIGGMRTSMPDPTCLELV